MRLGRVLTYTAQGALAPGQIVKFGAADGTVVAASATSDSQIGVVVSPVAVNAGDRVDVARGGFPDVQYGGNVTRGDLLTTDANGHAITVTRHAHQENTAAAYTQNAMTVAAPAVRTIGIAEVSAVAGDIGEMKLLIGVA